MLLRNALVSEGILALGIRQSVWEVENFFGRISHGVGAQVFSADKIEHGVVRGGRSCPTARRYHPAGLSEQADFDGLPGGLAGFLARYLEDGPARQAVFEGGVARLARRPFDWGLALSTPPDGRRDESWIVPA